jgi:spermidine synthase
MSSQARWQLFRGPGAGPDRAGAPGAWRFAAIASCFVLSGVAALAYQTAWLRQFSLVFGTAELAVATVLAAYMAGLATGAALVNRWLPHISRPLFVYAILELGVAFSALAVPYELAGLDWVMVMTIGHQPGPPAGQSFGHSLFYMGGAFVALLLPTGFMGATLPLLTRHTVHSDAQVGRRVGLLYAGNTLGAVSGTLAAGFVSLPRLGLAWTVVLAAFVNITASLAALFIARRTEPRSARTMARTPAEFVAHSQGASVRSALQPGPHWILPIMLLSGAVSFVYEVLWTRMLSHVLGSSIFAFATMLASVLAGIAIGGALAGELARKQRIASRSFVVAQLGTAAASAFVYLHLDRWIPAEGGLSHHPLLAVLLLLPATLLIGTTYPLAVRVLAGKSTTAETAAARVYSWNTIGAVFGALLAGLAVLPALRFEGTVQLAVDANLALALAALCLLDRPRLPWLVTVAAIALSGALLFRPPPPAQLLRASPLRVDSSGLMRYYDVGRSASVVVFERNGMLALRTNGLPEALIASRGAPPRFSGEFWLSPLATIAAPRATSMLVVGLGGGTVIEAAPPAIQSIDVIELEPRVLDANRAIAALRALDPLRDPRLNIILNDARAALALTDKRYDVIVSQPSHPWTAGASHLYTREFLLVVRRHLTEPGVFVQWMNIAYLDEALLRSFVATLLDVFPELEIYRPDPYTLLFVAAQSPLDTADRLARNSAPIWWAPDHYSRYGILSAEDVVTALVADRVSARALAGDAPLITDDRNRLATSSVYDLGRGLTPQSAGQLLAPYDPMRRAAGWLFADAARGLSLPYCARRLARFAQLDPTLAQRIDALAASVADQPTALYIRSLALNVRGDAAGAAKLLDEALAIAPENRQILYASVRPRIPAIAAGTADPQIVQRAARQTGSAAAVVQAAKFSAAGQWDKVAALDEALALANPTDAWYFDALVHRAEWRSHVANVEVLQQVGGECLAMVDRVIVSDPAVSLFQLRAQCAALLGRADAVVESIYAFAAGTRARLDTLSGSELAPLGSQFATLERVVAGAAQSADVDVDRAREVEQLVTSVADAIRTRTTGSQ